MMVRRGRLFVRLGGLAVGGVRGATIASPWCTAIAASTIALERQTQIALPTAAWAALELLGRIHVFGNPIKTAESSAVIVLTVLPCASHHVKACDAQTVNDAASTERTAGTPYRSLVWFLQWVAGRSRPAR